MRYGQRIRVSTLVSAWLPQGTPFTPLAYSPRAWFDASNAGSITAVSGAVSQWSDLSGNAYHVTQSTAASQPTTGSVTQNGLNALSFDGGDFLSGTTNVTGNASFTLFIVARVNAKTTTQAVMMLGAQTTNNGIGVGYNQTSDWYNAFIWGGAESKTATSVTVNVFKSFIVTRAAGGDITLYVNGVAQTGAATSTMNLTSTLNFGQSASSGSRLLLTGAICEAGVYSSVLTSDQIGVLAAYLSDKWAPA